VGIDTRGRSLGSKGLLELIKCLQFNDNSLLVRQITLTDAGITDQGSDMSFLHNLAGIIKDCTDLGHLDLSGNVLGTPGLRFMLRGIQPLLHSNLQELDLSRNALRSSGCSVLGALFQPHYKHHDADSTVSIGVANEADVQQLASKLPAEALRIPSPRSTPFIARKLHSLCLDANNITDFESTEEGAVALTEGLHHLPALRCLRLSHNRLTFKAVRALSDFLADSKVLETLWLNENKIDSEGAKLLAQAARTSKALQQLHLRGNEIASDGAAELARCFNDCPNFNFLDLRKNLLTAWGRLSLVQALHPNDPSVIQALDEQSATEHDKPLKFMTTPRLGSVTGLHKAELPPASGVGSVEADAAAKASSAEAVSFAAELADVPDDFATSTPQGIPALALGKVQSAVAMLPAAIVSAIMPSASDAEGKHFVSGAVTPRGEAAPEGMFEDGGHLFYKVTDVSASRSVIF